MDLAGGSAAALAFTAGTTQTTGGQAVFGPCLHEGMSGPQTVAALNAWGSARDRESLQLRADLTATQQEVSGAFAQAQGAVRKLVNAFRMEVTAMRQTTVWEAQQSLERLTQVVDEARAKFGEQDARFATGLGELARRFQEADAWAQDEPARVAALLLSAAPAQPAMPDWLRAPPSWLGGAPPPVPSTPPGRIGMGPALQTSPGWAAHAASLDARGPEPPDAWAAWAPQQQRPPHFNIASPPGFGDYHGGGGKGGGYNGDGGGKGGSYPRDLRINTRDWGDHKKLDVAATYDRFQVWKDRALTHLSKDRPDVRALLTWADTQSQGELETGLSAQATRLGVLDLAAVEYAIHDGIKGILLDTLLTRARNCVGRGFELWRALGAEWSGAAPQLRDARARSYQEPARCKDTHELWGRLAAWERLGEEVAMSNMVIPDWMRNMALEKLLPTQLLATLVSRNELVEFPVRLAWVKTQMEHARGIAQATSYGHGSGKDANGDVHMNSVEPEHSDGLAWALANAMEQQDWAQAEMLQGAIYAVKGNGKGGTRKGLGKGKPGPGAAQPAAKGGGAGQFQGNCNHCGIWGHRLAECRKRDQELGKKGGAKGDKGAGKGGKGGPKGGKGPPADANPINEVAGDAAGEDDDWADELAGDDGADEWHFHDTIASVAEWTPAKAVRRGARTWRPFGAGTPATHVKNSFSTLSALTADAAGTYTGQGPSTPTSSYIAVGTYTGQGPSTPTSSYIAAGAYTGQGPSTPITSRMPVQNEFGSAAAWAPRAAKNKLPTLSLLTDDAEELMCAVTPETRSGGRVVEAVVDSGAVHSVAPPGAFPGRTRPSAWSRAGRGYRAANGTGIKNLGVVGVSFATAEGHKCAIPFQVAEVEQPLLSVAHLTSAGNRVELGHTEGRIVNLTTGRSIALERRGGVYILRMFIADGAAQLPFHRQGA